MPASGLTLLAAVSLLALPSAAFARKDRGPAAPSQEVIRAWEKAGFRFAWLGKDRWGAMDQKERKSARAVVSAPVFLEPVPGAKLDGLPDPKVPFGIGLAAGQVTQETARQLAG